MVVYVCYRFPDQEEEAEETFFKQLEKVPQSEPVVLMCGGLTLAGHQVSTKPFYHSPPQQDGGEKIRWKKPRGSR